MMAVRNNRQTGVGAFTLIELLVVISIISLLVSILLPALGRAREQARQIQCQTNQRAVGMAIHMYTNEYNGQLPSAESWVSDIQPFLGGSQPENSLDSSRETMPPALFCPCDPDPFPKPFMTGQMEVTSYFVNGARTDFAMGGGREIKFGLFGGKYNMDRISATSECMMLGETSNYGKIVDIEHPAVIEAFDAVGANAEDIRTRFHHRATSAFFHQGEMSVVYVDGHSAPVKGKEVDALPLSQWPGGALMSARSSFFPTLSLPTATEYPAFWGPPYYDYD